MHGSLLHDASVPTKAELSAYVKLTNLTATLTNYIQITQLGNTLIVPPLGLFVDTTPRTVDVVLAALHNLLRQTTVVSKPNLIYNSTGMRDLDGWYNTTGVSIYHDNYLNDDDVHFVITGKKSDSTFLDALTSASIKLSPGTTYSLSCKYKTENGASLSLALGVQTTTQINTIDTLSQRTLVTNLQATNWTTHTVQLVADSTQPAHILRIAQPTNNPAAILRIQNIKLEEGSVATPWIPCYTDYSINSSVAITGTNAASFL